MSARHRPRARWWAHPLVFTLGVPALAAVPTWTALRVMHHWWWPVIPPMDYLTAYVVCLTVSAGAAVVSLAIDVASNVRHGGIPARRRRDDAGS